MLETHLNGLHQKRRHCLLNFEILQTRNDSFTRHSSLLYLWLMSVRSKILLALQFACFGYFLLYQEILASGVFILLQFFGFLLCLWSIAVMGIGNFNAQPEVKPRARLVKIGPYTRIRNPMYTGLLLFFGAGLISNFNWQGLAAWVSLALIFLLKIADEEKYLTERFGVSYKEYVSTTYRMIPYLF